MAGWMQEAITEACNFSMPVATNTRRDSTYWWNSQIAASRSECNKARRTWQKMKRKKNSTIDDILVVEEAYRCKKKILCTQIKEAKIQAWNELIRGIDEDPWGLPYKIVMKKLRRSSPSFGETLLTETLEQLVDKLFPQDPMHNEGVNDVEDYEPWLEEYDINIEEIGGILKKKAGTNKAPDIDGIKSVFLKKIPLEFMKEMIFVYNQKEPSLLTKRNLP